MNYYAKAIEKLTSGKIGVFDYKKICIEFAKHHPRYFVEAADVVTQCDWQKESARLYLEEGKFVDAIKHCRAITGMGLKDAKAAVEALGTLKETGQ